MLVHFLVIVGSSPCGLLVTVIRNQAGIVGYVLVSPATNCGYIHTLAVYCVRIFERSYIYWMNLNRYVYRYVLYV